MTTPHSDYPELSRRATIDDLVGVIQQLLKVPKGQFNQFGGFKYRSCEDILAALKPVLLHYGATITLDDEPVLVGDWHYIRSTARLDWGEEYRHTTGYAREPGSKKGMDASQITGSASSYARKTALAGMCALDDGIDADAGGEKPRIDPEQVEEIQRLLKSTKTNETRFMNWLKTSLKCDSLEDVTEDAYDDVVKRISSAAKRRQKTKEKADAGT